MYTELDGSWHTVTEGKKTLCGLMTTRDGTTDELPDDADLHCGEAPEKPKKAAAKTARA